MNLLEKIMSILNFEDWKKASDLPGWAHRPTRTRHSRTPYSSSRVRGSGEQHMTIEKFIDKEARNERYRTLRARGVRHVSKFSTVEENKSIWCVVRP